VRRYLPEALFFAPALLVLAALRLDPFGDVPGFLFVVVFVCLSMPGAIASALVVPVLAFKLRDRGAALAAPILGSALVAGSFILYMIFTILQISRDTPELYWDALWIIPVISIGLFIIARIRANPPAVFAYLVGAMLFAAEYMAMPSISAR
jgi:hypothetical protein